MLCSYDGLFVTHRDSVKLTGQEATQQLVLFEEDIACELTVTVDDCAV